jgi:sigma-B regulation protein RsbU (phosphoserine phosphatase)
VDDTITRMNRVMCKTVPENRFVTFFYGILDPAANTVTYVNAGQCPPLMVRGDGTSEVLAQSGPPLGLMLESTYKPFSISMQPGDVLVCYSDGVSEATSALTEEQFGEERLATVVHQDPSRSPTDMVRIITEAMATHCAGRAYQDDVTLVILKRMA